MIPILGETVWSIIHGPATTSHVFELSQFLRRPINVWAKDRLLLFGRCHHRHKPRLHLKHVSLPARRRECRRCGGWSLSSTSSAGHFTLLEGHEPRNPDARSHPENCGFDVVADQTGYPACVLRQVVAQRMLVKLYESRLRGRDHHFQCSRCSLSGGKLWTDSDSRKLIRTSGKKYRGHAHIHVYRESCDRQCACSGTNEELEKDGGLKFIGCMDKYLQISNPGEKSTKTLFECEEDLVECLTAVMRDAPAKAARRCIEQEHRPSCDQYRYDRHRASIGSPVAALQKRAYTFIWDLEGNRTTDFYFEIKYVRTILKSRTTGSNGKTSRVLYLETMYPIRIENEGKLPIPERMTRVFRPALRVQKPTSNSSSSTNEQKIASNASFLSIWSVWGGVRWCQPESGGPSTTAGQTAGSQLPSPNPSTSGTTPLRSASEQPSLQGLSAASPQSSRGRRSAPTFEKPKQFHSESTRRSLQGPSASGGQPTTAARMAGVDQRSSSNRSTDEKSSFRGERNQQFSQGQPESGGKSTPIKSSDAPKSKPLHQRIRRNLRIKDPLDVSESTQPKLQKKTTK